MSSVPTLTLNNGVTLPALGYGVFQTPPDETIAAVEAAGRETGWTGRRPGLYLAATETPPEEVRPMNAVSMWVLPVLSWSGD